MTTAARFRVDIERRAQLGEITRKEAFRLIAERQAQYAAAMSWALAASRLGMASAGAHAESDEPRNQATGRA